MISLDRTGGHRAWGGPGGLGGAEGWPGRGAGPASSGSPPMKRAGAPAALPPREALAWFALGCGVLFPWNCIVGASDYFAARFPPPRHPERALAVAYMLPNVCVVLGVLLLEGGGGGGSPGGRDARSGRRGSHRL